MNTQQLQKIEQELGTKETLHLYKTVKNRRRFGISLEVAVAIIAAVLIVLIFTLGCGTPGRTTYTTLASTEMAAKSSYDGYLDSVLSGQTRTNEVPLVSASFDEFQAAMRIAVSAASGNTNALVTSDVAAASAKLLKQINAVKGKK